MRVVAKADDQITGLTAGKAYEAEFCPIDQAYFVLRANSNLMRFAHQSLFDFELPKPSHPLLQALSPEYLRRLDDALADVLCWSAGFTATGGTGPGGLDALRSLRAVIQKAIP